MTEYCLTCTSVAHEYLCQFMMKCVLNECAFSDLITGNFKQKERNRCMKEKHLNKKGN